MSELIIEKKRLHQWIPIDWLLVFTGFALHNVKQYKKELAETFESLKQLGMIKRKSNGAVRDQKT